MVSGCGGMRPHLAGAVDAAGPQVCHCEEAAGRRGNLGKALPFGTSHRQNGNRPRLVIARRPQADVAISGRHFQFVQGTDKNVPTNCVCSGAHCAAVGGFAALRMRRPLYGVERLAGWQYSGHVFYGMRPPSLSFRGAKRRGNLKQALTISPGLSCVPGVYCEIAAAPAEPRNDKSGGLSPPGGAQ